MRGIHSLAFSPSGHLLAVGFGDGHCQLCRVPELSALVAVRLGLERLAALRFVSDELLAAGSWDQMVYLVSTSNVKSFRLLRGLERLQKGGFWAVLELFLGRGQGIRAR